MPTNMIQPALGGQHKIQPSDFNPSKTTPATRQQPTHLLIVAQDYNHHANLFCVPWYKEHTMKPLLDEPIRQFIKPSVFARPFMKYAVGTAVIVRVSWEGQEHEPLLKINEGCKLKLRYTNDGRTSGPQ